MLILYNIVQLTGLILFAPLLFVKAILNPKYRGRIGQRFGFGLGGLISPLPREKKRFWLHALSVGEVSSARPLVHGLRRAYPDAVLVLSTTTRSGFAYAKEVLGDTVDVILPFPYDFFWSVRHFVQCIRPDLFVLVETDFWPNLLAQLRRRKIPALLVNGRFSATGFRNYQRLRYLFAPLFDSFQLLSMQTESDAAKIRQLGVAAAKVATLGNLKYAVGLDQGFRALSREEVAIPAEKKIVVAGSTHDGEEKILFAVFARLIEEFPDLYLVLAPRDVDRVPRLLDQAHALGLKAASRSGPVLSRANVLLVDTFGELAGLYAMADVAFVGGSLVPERGHNPLEPAGFGKPVAFGPHMEDFSEISRDLLTARAAAMVESEEGLCTLLRGWLSDPVAARGAGEKGRNVITRRQEGIVARYLAAVGRLLEEKVS